MQTRFSPEQLRDPRIRQADSILRACVHCGFCTATCPTYVTLGDERDSPRGRIMLIKDLLEGGGEPSPAAVTHVDRCLSCLACMTTCPSGVDYGHLVQQARNRIEAANLRPAHERALRALVSHVIPNPRLMRWALRGAALARPFAGLARGRFRNLLEMAPRELPAATSPTARPGVFPAVGRRIARVAMLPVCAHPVLAPEIDAAAVRLLTRLGVEVVVARGSGCCGALVHHMGLEDRARAQASANIEAWWRQTREGGGEGLDAIIVTASGCGTMVKDYASLFEEGDAMREKAARIGALARDVCEFLAKTVRIAPKAATGQRVAYQTACSLQHGQKVVAPPKDLLRAAGFEVADIAEPHLCCGSAGVYNLLHPAMAGRLRDRKIANIERVRPTAVASGNIGCITHLQAATRLPIAHTVEFLDWATGGPKPPALEKNHNGGG